jgi:NmrA-like family
MAHRALKAHTFPEASYLTRCARQMNSQRNGSMTQGALYEKGIILVAGATGNQGGATARHLLADDWHVAPLVRDVSSEPARTTGAGWCRNRHQELRRRR